MNIPNLGINVDITKNGIDVSPIRNWANIAKTFTDREIEMIDCLTCISMNRTRSSQFVDDEVIDNASKFGYDRNELIAICNKMNEEELFMDMSFINFVGEHGWDNVWFIEHEFIVMVVKCMKNERKTNLSESEYLAQKHEKPEWLAIHI